MSLEKCKSPKAGRIPFAWAIRKGSGSLGLTEMEDGERMLYGEMQLVGLKLGHGKARSFYGELSSEVT